MEKEDSPYSINYDSQKDAGWARIETDIEACFSKNHTAIEFCPNDSEKTLVKVFTGDTENVLFIDKSEGEEFVKKVIFLGRKAEVRSESGWTKIVRIKVEWRNLTFSEEMSGKISAISNEWTIEEIEEYLPKIKDAQIAAKVRETLAKGLHRRALEINSETEKFVRRLLSAKDKL